MPKPNYNIEPVEVFEDRVWVVNDPWEAQDIGMFSTKEAAELFAKAWMERH